MTEPATIRDLRFRRDVAKLHARGPRWVAELLAELGAERSIQTIIENKLARYADVPDDAAALADRFPPIPVHEVPR